MAVKISFSKDLLKFDGALDENTPMNEIIEGASSFVREMPGVPLKLDLTHLTKANSCGILEWVTFLRSVAVTLHYINTPWWLIEQIEVNHLFLANNSIVKSFFAPFCDEDEQNFKNILLEVGKDFPILDSYEDFDFSREVDGVLYIPDFDPDESFNFIQGRVGLYKKIA